MLLPYVIGFLKGAGLKIVFDFKEFGSAGSLVGDAQAVGVDMQGEMIAVLDL